MHHMMHRVIQVWKKTLQPSPQISVCGGGVNQGAGAPHTARVELEVPLLRLGLGLGLGTLRVRVRVRVRHEAP